MSEFDELWKASARFRRVSRELEWLLRDVYDAFEDEAALRRALEALLAFLASDAGRTDANCSTTDHFVNATSEKWRNASEPLRAILEDMGGTLHDAIHAPNIARTFEATPEQLLVRVRQLGESANEVPPTSKDAFMTTIKSANAGEPQRASTITNESAAAAVTPPMTPEELAQKQARVRKKRRPPGPRRETVTRESAVEAPVSDVEPTEVEEGEYETSGE